MVVFSSSLVFRAIVRVAVVEVKVPSIQTREHVRERTAKVLIFGKVSYVIILSTLHGRLASPDAALICRSVIDSSWSERGDRDGRNP